MSAVDIFTYILIRPKSRVFLAAVFWMWVHCDSLKATKCQSYNGDVFDKWCIFLLTKPTRQGGINAKDFKKVHSSSVQN